MDMDLARRRVGEARVARLGTVSSGNRPHLVPCCFTLHDDVAYTAVDAKPKTTLTVRRVRNIGENPAVSLLVDAYEEDWAALWWVRLDGRGRVVDDAEEGERARHLLTEKYHQYRSLAIPGPVVAIEIERWTAWP